MNSYIGRPLVIGPSVVSVFFVLSGMVLYGTFDGKDDFQYGPYITKRLSRIYPPLAAAVLMSLALYWVIQPHDVRGVSGWFNENSWNEVPTLKLVAGHLLLIDPWRYSSLDNVIWSLVHEVRISIIFPIIALALRWRLWQTVVTSIVVSAVATWASRSGYSTGSINVIPTLQYVALFAAGGAMAIKYQTFVDWFDRPERDKWGVALLLSGVALLCCEKDPTLVGIGSVLTVFACFAARPIVKILNHAALVWLGRVSYSLYLTHLLVILTLVHLFATRAPLVGILAAAVPIALLVAYLSFRLIEEPSRLAGRRLAGAWAWRSRSADKRDLGCTS
jgi:peptidoglycan/LPS O-acetylase OafA/YrhL